MADCDNQKTFLRWLVPVLILAVVVGTVSVLWVTQGSSREMESLCSRSFNTDEQMKIRFALADAGLNDYTLENGTLRVPVCKRDLYLQTLSKAEVFVEEAACPKKSGLSIWRSEKERQECALREKQDVLSRQLRNFNGMDAACVLLDVSETKKGFSRIRTVTAAVTIRSQADYTVSDSDIAAIRMFVAGAVAELIPENVAIVDTRTNRSWRIGTPIPATAQAPVAEVPSTRRIAVHQPERTYDDVPQLVDEAAFDLLGKPATAPSETTTEVYKPVTSAQTPVKKNETSPIIWLLGVLGLVLVGLLTGIGIRCLRKKKQIIINVLEESTPAEKVSPECPTEKPIVSHSEVEILPEPVPEPEILVSHPEPIPEPVEKKVEPVVMESVELRQIRLTPADELALVLKEERPQTIALVLSRLQAEQSSEVLRCFDEKLRGEVVSRLAACEETDAEIVNDVLEMVVERLDQDACQELPPVYEVSVHKYRVDLSENDDETLPFPERRKNVGVQAISEILQSADERLGTQIREKLHDTPAGARLSLPKRPNWEDLTQFSDRAIRDILETIRPEEMLLALVGAAPELVDRLLRPLSSAEAEKIRTQIVSVGPTRLSDVSEARLRVMEHVYRLMLRKQIETPPLPENRIPAGITA